MFGINWDNTSLLVCFELSQYQLSRELLGANFCYSVNLFILFFGNSNCKVNLINFANILKKNTKIF
jgi:hypothetical protein